MRMLLCSIAFSMLVAGCQPAERASVMPEQLPPVLHQVHPATSTKEKKKVDETLRNIQDQLHELRDRSPIK